MEISIHCARLVGRIMDFVSVKFLLTKNHDKSSSDCWQIIRIINSINRILENIVFACMEYELIHSIYFLIISIFRFFEMISKSS